MCGIAGFLEFDSDRGISAKEMVDELHHRGPDSSGEFYECGGGYRLGLGHRRLSIQDLTEKGSQPMSSQSGRYVVVLNGEIYNHPGLRKSEALAGGQWRGSSDTETLLAGFDAWGIESCLKKLVGMFAFAVWDRQEKVLTLGRDRMGEKPLYFGWQCGSFLFGSELKAIKRHPDFLGEIDRESLALYLQFGYYPAPYSVYKGISKLRAGHFMQLRWDEKNEATSQSAYWSYLDHFDESDRINDSRSDADVIVELTSLLDDSVRGQRLADVPLGAFLSGGIDSSLVAAVLQKQSSRRVKTYCIGFEEKRFNEAPYAKAIAEHLGTEHTEFFVTATDTLKVIPGLSSIYDEPFGDSSAVPTTLVCRLAKDGVTVALSGDGGDELFGGYSHYLRDPVLWNRVGCFPANLRSLFGEGMRCSGSLLFKAGGKSPRMAALASRLKNLGSVLSTEDVVRFFETRRSVWKDPKKLLNGVLGGSRDCCFFEQYFRRNSAVGDAMMSVDILTYLSDDILVKVDRAAMAVSLETRVPLLDHRVVEFSAGLPSRFKIREGKGKWALRQVLATHMPRDLFERPKKGFAVPLDEWLRGPLREWMIDLLDERSLEKHGLFNVEYVRQIMDEHINGLGQHGIRLWPLLTFLDWKANN